MLVLAALASCEHWMAVSHGTARLAATVKGKEGRKEGRKGKSQTAGYRYGCVLLLLILRRYRTVKSLGGKSIVRSPAEISPSTQDGFSLSS